MKKVTKIVTLVATGLCALALVPATLGMAMSAGVAENDYHTITYVADDEVLVSAPVVAKAGKNVNVTLTYDDDAYFVYELLVNGEEFAAMTSISYHDFMFIMPDEDTRIDIIGEVMEPEPGQYAVINVNANQGVVLNNITGLGYAGYYEIFSVGMDPNSIYQWDGTLAVYPIGEDGEYGQRLQILYAGGQNYAFLMPDAPVAVVAGVERKVMLLTYNYADYEFLDSVKYQIPGEEDFISVDLRNAGYLYKEGTSYSVAIPIGSAVEVTLKNTNKLKPTNLKLGDAVLDPAQDTLKFSFEMPAKDSVISAVGETLWREISVRADDFGSLFDWTMRVAPSSSGEFVEREELHAVYGEYVRLYPTSKATGADASKPKAISMYKDGSLSTTGLSTGTDDYGYYIQISVQAANYEVVISSVYKAHTMDAATCTTEHISAKMVTKVGDAWVEKTPATYFYGEYAYIQFTITGEEYGVGSPVLRYGTSSYQTSELRVEDAANNVYKSAGTLGDYDYKVEFEEKYAQFKGYCFIGTYAGNNLYNGTRKSLSTSTTYTITFDEFGGAKKSSSNYSFAADGDNTVKNGQGTLLVNGYKVVYSERWYLAHYSPSQSIDIASDWMIAFKPEVAGTTFTLRQDLMSGKFMAVQAVDGDGNILGQMCFIPKKSYYLEKVEFVFSRGTYVNEAGACYEVKVDGVTIGSVSTSSATSTSGTWTPAA